MAIHPTIEQLDLSLRGKLDPRTEGMVRHHVSSCPTCENIYHQCAANLDMSTALRRAMRGWSVRAAKVDEIQARRPTSTEPLDQMFPGYEIVREVCQGGQGVVYEALQSFTQRRVALKVLLGGEFAQAAPRERFAREIELAARLDHPNIVVIFDSGDAAGNPYFSMEYIEGKPINQHVQAGGLSFSEIASILIQVSDAVSHAHQRGVIHRDLKPSNILVSPDGTPHLLDFGLARTEETNDTTKVSISGQVLGTLKYMSPEQTNGSPEGIDTRTDIYSIGVMAYELLVGCLPYDADGDLETGLRNIRESMPARPRGIRKDVPWELERIVLTALEKDPDHRYQSASQLRDDFGAWLSGLPISVNAPSSLYLMRKLISRHKIAATVVVSLFIILSSFASISFELYRRTKFALEERDAMAEVATRGQQDIMTVASVHVGEIRNSAMEAFLDRWREGDMAAARRLQVAMGELLPDSVAARYLLEDISDWEGLRSRLSPDAWALADIVRGEQLSQKGYFLEASAAFESAIGTDGNPRFRRLAASRLKSLEQAGSLRAAGLEE